MMIKAFSLVEILVVIAILAIIAALLIPLVIPDTEVQPCKAKVTNLFTYKDGLYVATDKGVYALPTTTVEQRATSLQTYGGLSIGETLEMQIQPAKGMRKTPVIVEIENTKVEND